MWGQAITLAFHTDPSTPMPIFSDATQQFLLNYVGTAPGADVLGQADDVRHYTVLHEDLAGNSINSALNGASVDVGDALGLVRCFRIDSFPQVLAPLELVGQLPEQLGLYRITPAVIEDHQPGDRVQWHERSTASMGPPSWNYDRYRTYLFLARTDGADQVSYSVRQEVFDAGAPTMTVDTLQLTFDRNEVVAALPFEQFDGTFPQLAQGDDCGLHLWHYRTIPNPGLAYCAEERCWGPYDTNGPPPSGWTEDVLGLGRSSYRSENGPISGFHVTENRIVHYVKNGVTCGDEIAVGTASVAGPSTAVRVAPVPTNGPLTLEAARPMLAVVLYDPAGAEVLRAALSGTRGQLDAGALRAGLYVARILFADGGEARTRIVMAGR